MAGTQKIYLSALLALWVTFIGGKWYYPGLQVTSR